MSSILIGGVNEIGDWVYNPDIDDYEWVVTGYQGYPACPECCECLAPTTEYRYRGAIKFRCGYSVSGCAYTFLRIDMADTSGVRPCGTEVVTCSSTSATRSPVYSGTTGYQLTDPDTCGNTISIVGSINDCQTWTYSEPYTDALIFSLTSAKLAATSYSAWSVGTPTSYRDGLGDCALSESLYRFRFKVPKVGSGIKYIIKWVERFSPTGGGAVTDTIKTFTWDGTIPGGYDATVSATWPLSDEYTMSVPATDGTVEIACITATCSGTSPTDPCNP